MVKWRYLIFIFCVCAGQLTFAQEYVRLDKSKYRLHLSESPKDTVRIIESGRAVKLKQGNYIVQNNQFMGAANAFVHVGKEGLIEGNFKIEKGDQHGIVRTRHGILEQMIVKTGELLHFQYVFTDTSSLRRDYKNGRISQEKRVFYYPQVKKTVLKTFYDSYYTIENDFDHTRSDYSLDNRLLFRAKLDGSGQVSASKSFDREGRLVKHYYRKNDVYYTDLYHQNNLSERIYKMNNSICHEYFKDQLLVKRIVHKKGKQSHEKYVYNAEGILLEQQTKKSNGA